MGSKRKERSSDESRCAKCQDPIVGLKVATEACGVLCVPCARVLYGFELGTGKLIKLGKDDR